MDYQKQADNFAKKHGVTLTILGKAYKKHFSDDKEPRFVYSLELSRGEEFYQFEFGQSLASIKFEQIKRKVKTAKAYKIVNSWIRRTHHKFNVVVHRFDILHKLVRLRNLLF